MNIYVGNLSSRTNEEDITEAFAKFGQVNSVKLILDRDTGQPRGFAFVDMSEEDGKNAIESLNETELDGNSIIVSEAFERRNNNNNNNRGNFRRNNNYNRNYDRD